MGMNGGQPWLLIAALTVGACTLIRVRERLRHTEAKLDALLKHFGMEWGQFSEPSKRIKDLAQDPRSNIQAIRAYREQTGLGLKKAEEVLIEGLAKHTRP